MNPHWFFLGLLAASMAATILYIAETGQTERANVMLVVLAVTASIVGIALAVTRKYWRDARRLA
jgi:hypothetical protein